MTAFELDQKMANLEQELLRVRRSVNWEPKVPVCVACEYGDHGQDYVSLGMACSCACHGKGE